MCSVITAMKVTFYTLLHSLLYLFFILRRSILLVIFYVLCYVPVPQSRAESGSNRLTKI